MKKLIALLVLLAFALPIPARAEMVMDYDSLEKDIFLKEKPQPPEPAKEQYQKIKEQINVAETEKQPAVKPEEKSGSSWWKWALAIALVGGLAAAAGGGGGGGGGSSTPASSSSSGPPWPPSDLGNHRGVAPNTCNRRLHIGIIVC